MRWWNYRKFWSIFDQSIKCTINIFMKNIQCFCTVFFFRYSNRTFNKMLQKLTCNKKKNTNTLLVTKKKKNVFEHKKFRILSRKSPPPPPSIDVCNVCVKKNTSNFRICFRKPILHGVGVKSPFVCSLSKTHTKKKLCCLDFFVPVFLLLICLEKNEKGWLQ